MGGLSGTVEWWEGSQLRVLVLASLCVQYFLTFFAGWRKFSVPSWFRFAIWLTYLGNDALAIYALATLFNRHKKPSSSHGGSRDLEVLWAPFMLIHLGGQVFITAYNIEDNELWRRHIVTALSQVTVALYVFCESWSFSADRKLLTVAILNFIPGIVKCFAKPWSLMSASFHSLTNSFDLAKRTTAASREEELTEYVQKARTYVLAKDDYPSAGPYYIPEMLFVDFAYTYSRRLDNLRSFCVFDEDQAFRSLQYGLSNTFDLLYTRKKTTGDDEDDTTGDQDAGLVIWEFSFLLSIVAVVLFHISHKKDYSSADVAITFVLLYSTILLECSTPTIMDVFQSKWPDTVAQRSILGQFAHNKRHSKLMNLATRLQCKDFLDQHWSSVEPCQSSQNITILVRTHLQDGWKEYITNVESYRSSMISGDSGHLSVRDAMDD